MARSSYQAKLKTVRTLAGASAARVVSRRRKTIPQRVLLFCQLKILMLRLSCYFYDHQRSTPRDSSHCLTSLIISELLSERSMPVISYSLNSQEGVGAGSASESRIEVTLFDVHL